MRPEGFEFAHCFNEVVETLVYALRALGHEATYQANAIVKGAQNIVLGAHLCDPSVQFPEGTILYNLEPIGSGAPIAAQLTARFPIWDYSPVNIAHWYEHGIHAEYVPIGYVQELTRIAPAISPDIDVLFYGTLNARRAKILQQLQETPGIDARVVLSFGRPRDSFIARAKVVLNMHYHDTPHLFEIVRVSYLLSNVKCVVCETSDDFPFRLLDGVRNANYNDLAAACIELVKDGNARAKLASAGFQKFSKWKETDILRVVLSHLSQDIHKTTPENGAPDPTTAN